MESHHDVAKGFFLTFGGGTVIAVVLIALFVWADSTGSSGGGGKASASPATTSTAAPAANEAPTGSTASSEMTTETSGSTGKSTTETSKGSTEKATTGNATVSAAQGKTIFSGSCGGCHTLADAGTSGNVGPNLDDLKPDIATVQHQVENGGGGMPAFGGQLKPGEIAAVAKYVSSVAGKGGGGSEPPAGGLP